MRGRDYTLPQDLADIAPDILRHRLVLSYDALADDIPADRIVQRILDVVPLPAVAPRQSASPRPDFVLPPTSPLPDDLRAAGTPQAPPGSLPAYPTRN
jgi:MoxR-like ATPase